jgi:hypothetical protein
MMQSGGRGALSSPSAAGGASSLAATVEAMKVSELRSRLQAAGHSTDGKKSDLPDNLTPARVVGLVSEAIHD